MHLAPMFRSVRAAAPDVEAELRELPATHAAFLEEGSWVVLGPTGLFVVTDGATGLYEAALSSVLGAFRLRSDLATELAWVPFVDALVVADDAPPADELPCPAVPFRMLRSILSEGPRIVDEQTLAWILARRSGATTG
jgi:hypothetical protein